MEEKESKGGQGIFTSLIRSVELEDSFFIGISQQLTGETEDGGRLADAGHAGDDEVGHVAVFGDDFEAVDRFCVADYVGEVGGAVFLDPGDG